ncbi:MAG: MoxR family ATPase [Lachnospiraceae bacterium]|nr:MoxR family ATPase [Lachnospiraceae bacterium]
MKGKVLELFDELNKVILGKEQAIKYLLTAMLADGHVLIEDVPGCGKTTLAKALALLLSGEFKRIQFTPDLLPADITGLSIYNTKEQDFVFKKGPVFSNILLADEINRATPRTQSALLEAMQERQVTIDSICYSLPDEFFVIATENPVETAGTFTLPEAELDRFFMQIELGYPSKEMEIALLSDRLSSDPIDDLRPVISLDEIKSVKDEIKKVFIHPCLLEYVADIARASRETSSYAAGISPRGSITLVKCSKTYAYLNDRSFVTPDDIQELSIPVLAHRLIPSNGYTSRVQAIESLKAIINKVNVPTENFRG